MRQCRYCGKSIEGGFECEACYEKLELPPITREELFEAALQVLDADGIGDLEHEACAFAQFVLDKCYPDNRICFAKMYDYNDITGEDYYKQYWERKASKGSK